MVCCFIGYELEGMSCMIYCLCMILMLWKFLIGGWDMYKVWVGHNSMTLVVRDLGGVSFVGRNSMDPLKGNFMVVPRRKDVIPRGVVVVPQGQGVIPRRPRGGASCKGVIPRRPRGDASLLGHNSTATWWCLDIRIRIVKSWSLIHVFDSSGVMLVIYV